MKQREGITAQRRRPRFPWRRSAASSELLWKSEMRLRTDKSGDTVGRPSCRSLLLGDPGAKFLVETGHPHRTNEKLTKFREHLSQSR
jgi:hypothetical protein